MVVLIVSFGVCDMIIDVRYSLFLVVSSTASDLVVLVVNAPERW